MLVDIMTKPKSPAQFSSLREKGKDFGTKNGRSSGRVGEKTSRLAATKLCQ